MVLSAHQVAQHPSRAVLIATSHVSADAINIAGIEIPSSNPVFLALVGMHVLLGLTRTIAGVIAMLSPKRSGRHPRFGTIYY